MHNPFHSRAMPLSGPAQDIIPVTPSDTVDLAAVAVALYVEGGGNLRVTTVRGNQRTVAVPDMCILPVGVLRVHATGTTATGIHALGI
ncbi:spike base protein, RCAP_Rcc01079 family [Pseudogemmobacter sonorensis]|uniref:spike base protein, RCAP_Rcc01079 family n=1 Tax=Pseudogemmobacter sonorensis TaxID=2989681 RepID=UPI00369D6F76